MTFALTPPGDAGPVMARSDRFQMYVRHEDGGRLDGDQRRAADVFVEQLRMNKVEGGAAAKAGGKRLPLVTAAADSVQTEEHTEEQAPETSHPWRPVSRQLEQNGLNAAIAALEQATDPAARTCRGELLLWSGRVDDAVAELEGVREASPELEEPVYGLVAAALVRRKWSEAMSMVGDGEVPRHLGLAGEAHREVGLWHDGSEALRAALDAEPGWVSAWLNLALIEAERGRRPRMTRAVERVVALAPGYLEDMLGDLGMRRFARDQPGEVAKVFQHGLKMLRGNRDPRAGDLVHARRHDARPLHQALVW